MIPKWRPVQICCIGQGRRKQWEQGAIAPSPQIWADELTLFQGGGADYAHNITYRPPPRVFKPSYGPEALEAPKAPIVPPSPYFTFLGYASS